MITREGYPAEAHVVTTDDGYLLTLHRIPGAPGSLPIFIQHGFLGSSADWVISGKNRALRKKLFLYVIIITNNHLLNLFFVQINIYFVERKKKMKLFK